MGTLAEALEIGSRVAYLDRVEAARPNEVVGPIEMSDLLELDLELAGAADQVEVARAEFADQIDQTVQVAEGAYEESSQGAQVHEAGLGT